MKNPSQPNDQDILKQLDAILISTDFSASKKQRQFLCHIVRETLAGRAGDIKGYSIALTVYGRDESFDPQTDPIVRVEAGRLRQALKYYYLTGGKNDSTLLEVPKGGYRPLFTERHVHSNPHPAAPHHETIKNNSIAVLPLFNTSGDTEQEYFFDGLTEELTTELARYQDFVVIASQSSIRFKNRVRDYRAIGQKLGARFLLEGSLHTGRSNLKVIIRLIDSYKDEQVWSSDYKSTINPADFIQLNEDISREVVGIIADQFGIVARRLSKESNKAIPQTMTAYDAVLRFYHFETNLTKVAFESAFSSLSKAVQLDPDYGLAWSMLGHLHADNHALQFIPIEAPLEQALRCAKKGCKLDPENQFANDALSLVYFHLGEKELFLQYVKKTNELNPNSPYITGVTGWHLVLYGQWDEGLLLLQRGMLLNPYYPTWFHLASFAAHYHQSEYEKAYAEAMKFNHPELFWDQVMRASSLAELSRSEEARCVIEELLRLQPNFENNGRTLICNYVKVESLIQNIITGLRKAGLRLQ